MGRRSIFLNFSRADFGGFSSLYAYYEQLVYFPKFLLRVSEFLLTTNLRSEFGTTYKDYNSCEQWFIFNLVRTCLVDLQYYDELIRLNGDNIISYTIVTTACSTTFTRLLELHLTHKLAKHD